MADTRLEPLVLTGGERRTLENWAKRRSTAQGLALRARIVLACAQGGSNVAVAARLGVNRGTVSKWRARFLRKRLDGLSDEPGPGVPRSISDAQGEGVVVRTLEEVPEGATHWLKRELARRVGISPTSVHRIWRAFGLQPWRTETFKLSPDPLLIDKIRDVVGLYLAPPANAAVFCVDEKPQIQALERTAPVLPMLPGVPERRSFDYARHDRLVRRAEHRHRQGHRQAVRPAPGGGLPRLPGRDRPPGPRWPGRPRNMRQPLRPQGTCGPALAAGPPALRAPLHPDLRLMDQPGRAMVRRTATTLPRTRCVLLPRRAHHRARRLDQDLEQQRPALQMDQDRRPDHRPHLPLLLTHLRTGTLAGGQRRRRVRVRLCGRQRSSARAYCASVPFGEKLWQWRVRVFLGTAAQTGPASWRCCASWRS